MPTSIDIARLAGVSQATVSRVLNADARVAERTRQRVLDVIHELGYAPNAIARGLASRRTDLVGVVVSDVTNPFYPELLEAISARLWERGLKMLLWNGAGGSGEAYIRTLVEQRVDGIIFTSVLADSSAVRSLVERDFPVVLTNRYVRGLACDAVVGDNRNGARAAATHLLALGHRRIAVLTGNPRTTTSRDRVSAFRVRLRDAGVELAAQAVGEFRHDHAFAAALRLLDAPRAPTALFCVNDVMAFGALNAATRLGLEPGRDVSVVGFDDIPMAAWDVLQLTTARQPLPEMATSSVDLLAERIAVPDRPKRRLVFPSTLVVRRTTGPPPRGPGQ